MEQEKAEKQRQKEEEERRRKREAKQRMKRMLEAAFDGDLDEMSTVLKEVTFFQRTPTKKLIFFVELS